jgi:hypothetical protein
VVNLAKYNLHWREGFTYGFEKRRDLYQRLIDHLDVPQVLGIVGLRRTGKTVLLKQVMDRLIEEGVDRWRIVYFSFDEERPVVDDLMEEYQSRVGRDLLEAGRVYVFLDEVQKLENWQNQVKFYYDTYPEVKFFVSGSSSLFLKKKAEESLAGRIFLFHLPVLSFREYLRFKGMEEMAQNPGLFRERLKAEVLTYMRRQLPELVGAGDDFIGMYVDSIISKVVYEDIPKVFPVEYGDVLKGLLRVAASNPGLLTDYETLAGELGVSRKTLANYVAYLEKAFLLQKCYNFSRNLLTSEKRLKRLYLTSTTFLFSLAEPLEMGKAVENLVVNAAQAKFFWRDVRHEVDAVLVEGKRIIPVESKYRNNISRKDIKGLLKFMERFSLSEGYVITETLEREEKIGDKKIIYLPLWKWLLGG